MHLLHISLFNRVKFQLRPYQNAALTSIRELFKTGEKKVLLHLATGGGKTVVFCEVLKRTTENNKYSIIVVKGRKLVEQASDRLTREGVEHGVLMAGHKLENPFALVQVCSIDTLTSRKLKPNADLIVIDEAHMATSESYIKFLSQYENAFILAVTATPYVQKSLRHIANQVVNPVSYDELVSLGFLVPARYFAPVNVDLRGVKRTNTQYGKDYSNADLARVMAVNQVVDNIVDKWQQFGENRPTICFCVNIEHSKYMAQKFNENDIPAIHLDASNPDKIRNRAIELFEQGEIKVICNVNIFSTGVDIPSIGCVVSARPTLSLILYIQQMGRGTRIHPTKDDFIIIDCGGNVMRHGFINNNHPVDLDGRPPQKKLPDCKTCPECYVIYQGKKCHHCGFEPKAETVQRKGKEFISTDFAEIKKDGPLQAFISLTKIRKDRKYNFYWTYHQLVKLYNEEIAKRFFPNYGKWKRS